MKLPVPVSGFPGLEVLLYSTISEIVSNGNWFIRSPAMKGHPMKFTAKEILKVEVAPALGCTEPTAVALCTAAARSLLSETRHVDQIELWLDPNLFKNGLAVAIPGTGGRSGLDLAAAIGVVVGDPTLKMEVLTPVTPADVDRASAMVAQNRIRLNLLEQHRGLYVRARVVQADQEAMCTIEVLHDNITELVLNQSPITDSPLLSTSGKSDGPNAAEVEKTLKTATLDQVIRLMHQLDAEDLAFIARGVEMNMTLAAHGLSHDCGLRVGATLRDLADKGLIAGDVIHSARMLTAAAGDARMSGAPLPAMSSAGSGNHGLTAIIPVKAVADHIQAAPEDLYRAVGLSHLITACVKAHTGRLAAICACSVAAGAGAAGAIAWLLGAGPEQIGGAVENIIEDLAGVICDGAKNSCAIKLDTAAGAAVQAALFAVHGLSVQMTDGIVGASPEKTIRNIGILSSEGMVETDRVILKIMLDKIRGR